MRYLIGIDIGTTGAKSVLIVLPDRFAALITAASPQCLASPTLGDAEFLLRVNHCLFTPLRAG